MNNRFHQLSNIPPAYLHPDEIDLVEESREWDERKSAVQKEEL